MNETTLYSYCPKVGDKVEMWTTRGIWERGRIEDIFRGPLTGATIYDIDGVGYYAHEIREPATVNA